MKNQKGSAHGQPLVPSAEKLSKNSKQEQENQINFEFTCFIL